VRHDRAEHYRAAAARGDRAPPAPAPGDRVVYELRGRTVAEVVLWSAPLVIPVDYVAVRFAGRANDVHYRSQTYLAVAR